MVGEPVQRRAGEAFRSEHLSPLVERQIGGHHYGTPLVALAEDLGEQFRTGAEQLVLQVEQPQTNCKPSRMAGGATSGPFAERVLGA